VIDVAALAEEARLRLAHALLALDRPAAAAEALRPLLTDPQPADAVGGALLAGGAVLDALAAAPWGDALSPCGIDLLRRWARLSARCRRAPEPAAPDGGDGPLSARELQVLERIAAGDSNKLIARALDLSPHTVKRHVAHILNKLSVSARREAADWYAARTAEAPARSPAERVDA